MNNISYSDYSDRQFNALQQTAYQLSANADRLFEQIERERILTNITEKIRASLDFETIFTTTVTEIRKLLNADRVALFRFDPESGWDDGEFTAEDVDPEFPSALAAKVRDHCFGSQFAVYYTQGRVQAVSDIHDAGLSDCHIEILAQFHIRANLIVPVLKGQELWGLLCIHQCRHPRRWQLSEIEFVQKIAEHLAIALQQTDYLEQIKHQAELINQAQSREKALLRQKTLVKIANRIRQSFEWETICQTATEEVRQLLEADRAAVYRFNPDWSGDFLFESVAEGWNLLVGVFPTVEDTYLMETRGGRYARNETFAVENIYEVGHTDCHIAFLEQLQVKAYAIAPIFQGEQLWGLLGVYQNSAPRQWQEDEIELIAQVGEQLGIALKQAEFVETIQSQSLQLQQTLHDLKQSQLQVIQNEKMAGLGQLVAGIAHEINNPINFIHGNLHHVAEYATNLLSLTRFYQEGNFQSEDNVRAFQQQVKEIEIEFIQEDLPNLLTSMKVGVDRIKTLISSLRNFSRLDESAIKEVDIHEGIDSTLLLLSNRLKILNDSTEVRIIKNYAKIPLIQCYPAQLNQVFMNLLTNALDSLEEAVKTGQWVRDRSPAIEISTSSPSADRIEIAIRDNGIGIEEQNLSRIFDYFFTTKSVGKGTGLGLAIARQIIVEKHGGTLEAKSTPNQETEFQISLPIALKKQ